jgi:hypothetical protein
MLWLIQPAGLGDAGFSFRHADYSSNGRDPLNGRGPASFVDDFYSGQPDFQVSGMIARIAFPPIR